jgi:DNA-binding NarL/FixJ family response regulator
MSSPNGSTISGLGLTARLRLVVADDHPRLLEEIRDLLNCEFDVVQAVGGGLELVKAAERIRPDAVVSDISMPGLNGIEAGQRILEGGTCGAVLLLTMHDDPQLIARAMEVGIRGYILKVDAAEELIEGVRAVNRGETYLSRRIRAAAISEIHQRSL